MTHHHETGYFGRAAPGKATPPHYPGSAPGTKNRTKTKRSFCNMKRATSTPAGLNVKKITAYLKG